MDFLTTQEARHASAWAHELAQDRAASEACADGVHADDCPHECGGKKTASVHPFNEGGELNRYDEELLPAYCFLCDRNGYVPALADDDAPGTIYHAPLPERLPADLREGEMRRSA